MTTINDHIYHASKIKPCVNINSFLSMT